jgi:hypothetical protein
VKRLEPASPPGTPCGALESLGRLLGAWNTEATHPALPGVVVPGTADIEWLEGNRFLIQRTRAEHPDFPDAVSIIGLMDRDRVEPAQSPGAAAANTTEAPTPRLCMHYYDSRGVFRVYEAGADEGTWRLWRDAPGFSQRFTGTFADGGDTIIGLWQVSRDDMLWEDDLRITFRRQQSRRNE